MKRHAIRAASIADAEHGRPERSAIFRQKSASSASGQQTRIGHDWQTPGEHCAGFK
jgi:hypothetical protein